MDSIRFCSVAGAPAFRTGNLHVRQKLHIQADNAGSIADRTAEFSRVVGKIACLNACRLRFRRFGVYFPQLVVDIGVGGHSGAHVDSDWRGVNQLYMADAVRLHCLYMGGQLLTGREGFQSGHQTLQNQCGLPGAGYAGNDGHPPLWNIHIQGLYRVNLFGSQMNPSLLKQLVRAVGLFHCNLLSSGQVRSHKGMGIFLDFGNRSLGDDLPSPGSRPRSHFNQPVGFG